MTELLEFEWVMRGFYLMTRKENARLLRALLSIEHIAIEDRRAVLMAVDAFETGLDLADALHMARCGSATTFATFDRRVAKRASRASLTPPVELLK